MATGDLLWDFGRKHGQEYLEQYQKSSQTGIYDPEIKSFEEWLQKKYHLKSNYLSFLSYIFTEDSRLGLIDDHISPIKTDRDDYTLFLVGVVKAKYKDLTTDQIKAYITFLRGAYKEYVIEKEQDRIAAMDKWDREKPLLPYNPYRTWEEAIWGRGYSGKKSHKKSHKKLHKKSPKKLHKKSYKK